MKTVIKFKEQVIMELDYMLPVADYFTIGNVTYSVSSTGFALDTKTLTITLI